MEALKVFNFEENEVRTITIDEEPYFVGKDVADVLGYSNSRDALNSHVDEEDKTILTSRITTLENIPNRGLTAINESGLYALIFSSRLESSRRFKRWVTSEVLPTIRQTGKYEAPKDPMEIMRLQFEALDQTNKKVDTIEKDVTYLKDEVKLDAGEYDYLSRQVKRNVRDVMNFYNYANTNEVRAELYKDINSGVNEICNIRTRTQLRQKHFEKAMEYINAWVPSTATKMKVQQLTMDLETE